MAFPGRDQLYETTFPSPNRPVIKPKPAWVSKPGLETKPSTVTRPLALKKPQTCKLENPGGCRHEHICREGLSYLSQVHQSLSYLLDVKDDLSREFSSDDDVTKGLTKTFRDVESLKAAYDLILEKVDKLKATDPSRVFLDEVFLDPVVSNLLKVYKPFISQYSHSSKWISDFYKKKSHNFDDSATKTNAVLEGRKVVNSFYTVFNSIFCLELILERYHKCFKESNEHFPRTKTAQESISNILDFINANSAQEDFLVAHNEFKLLLNKSGGTKVNARFIMKGFVTKVARRNQKPLPRQLVLFSDCLYVTLVPWNTHGSSIVRQELSVSTLEVCEIQRREDLSEDTSSLYALTISAREAVQDFYFENQETMIIWKKKLQETVREQRVCESAPGTIEKMRGLATLGFEAPRWQKDSAAGFCNGYDCIQKFGTLVRRHHCRADGLLYCDCCCSFRLRLTFERSSERSRVCGLCYDILGPRSEDPRLLQLSMKKLEEVMRRRTRRGRRVGALCVRVFDLDRNMFSSSIKYLGELKEEGALLDLYERQEDKCVSERIRLLGMHIMRRRDDDCAFSLQDQDKRDMFQITVSNPEDCSRWIQDMECIISLSFYQCPKSEDEFESEEDFDVDIDMTVSL